MKKIIIKFVNDISMLKKIWNIPGSFEIMYYDFRIIVDYMNYNLVWINGIMSPWIWRVYLPLNKVADTPFLI